MIIARHRAAQQHPVPSSGGRHDYDDDDDCGDGEEGNDGAAVTSPDGPSGVLLGHHHFGWE